MKGNYLTVANGITLFRLILFGVFVGLLLAGQLAPALAFLGLAWALDAVDGLIARRLGQASELGSELDKFTDRLIIIMGVLLLIRVSDLPPWAIFLLCKDIALVPALTIHPARHENFIGLGLVGKLMTLLQGIGVAWLVVGFPGGPIVVSVVGAAGATAGWWHLRRITR